MWIQVGPGARAHAHVSPPRPSGPARGGGHAWAAHYAAVHHVPRMHHVMVGALMGEEWPCPEDPHHCSMHGGHHVRRCALRSRLKPR